MDAGKILYLVLQGVILGFGPCLLICAPILIPYTIHKDHWYDGLVATLEFSVGRLAAYMVLGGLVGMVGAMFADMFFATMIHYYVQGVLAFVLIIIGILILFGKETGLRFCQLHQGNMITLGVLVGLSPCLPMLGMLLEVALIANNFLDGVIYSFAFGIGTVISPLLILGTFAPSFGSKISIDMRNLFVFICGLLLIVMGLYVFYNLVGMFRV
jgi:sulfite exporter TauE/SafE